MWKAFVVATTLVLISTCALAPPGFAEHFVPTVEEPLRINFYCTAVEEMQAYIFEGQPELIPDDIDCWWSKFPLMGIFTEPSQGEARDPNTGVTYQIHEIEPVFFINPLGYVEKFQIVDDDGRATPIPVFIGVRPHGQNS